jgi:hypothetical protein
VRRPHLFNHPWHEIAWLGCLPLLGVLLPQSTACAQVAPAITLDYDTVTTRARPGYDPVGVQVGAFRMFPSLTSTLAYNDNIYAVRQPRVDDASLSLKPHVEVRSQWQRNMLNLTMDAAFNRYLHQHTENTGTYAGTVNGLFAMGGDTRLYGLATVARRIESRGSTGDTLFGAKPIAYRELSGSLNLDRDFGPTLVGLGADYSSYRYENRTLGGATIDLRNRNYQTVSGDVKVTRAIGPGVGVFGDFALNSSRYTDDATNVSRSSHGYSVIGGVSFGLSRLLQGEIGAGYQRQTFDDPLFPQISGLDYRARLRWSPTRLLTVNADATRTIQRSPLIGVAGVRQQDFTLSADYELRRNMLVHPSFGYLIADFKGIGRTDHYLNGSMKLTWLLSDRFVATAEAARGRARPSTGGAGGRQYDQNRVSIGLTARF